MLILTRRVGESLTIDGNIKLSVLSIKGNQIRIGVDAPKDVLIQRSELIVDIDENNENSREKED